MKYLMGLVTLTVLGFFILCGIGWAVEQPVSESHTRMVTMTADYCDTLGQVVYQAAQLRDVDSYAHIVSELQSRGVELDDMTKVAIRTTFRPELANVDAGVLAGSSRMACIKQHVGET